MENRRNTRTEVSWHYPPFIYVFILWLKNVKFLLLCVYTECVLQLSNSSEQFCVSKGKLLKSIEQRAVTVTLKHPHTDIKQLPLQLSLTVRSYSLLPRNSSKPKSQKSENRAGKQRLKQESRRVFFPSCNNFCFASLSHLIHTHQIVQIVTRCLIPDLLFSENNVIRGRNLFLRDFGPIVWSYWHGSFPPFLQISWLQIRDQISCSNTSHA